VSPCLVFSGFAFRCQGTGIGLKVHVPLYLQSCCKYDLSVSLPDPDGRGDSLIEVLMYCLCYWGALLAELSRTHIWKC
jgi:hypothetical protein